MNPKQIGAIRRAVIYFVVGYGGLAVINNSGLESDRMWMAYVPLFIAVYVFARWADSKIAAFNQQRGEKDSAP